MVRPLENAIIHFWLNYFILTCFCLLKNLSNGSTVMDRKTGKIARAKKKKKNVRKHKY